MKRGKDEEKIMGPMFPRLHVNDTEKGGPRAPPRNKMALYEQLSIPSQRSSQVVMQRNPNNNAPNSVPPSSQGGGYEGGMFFSRQVRPRYPSEKQYSQYSELNTPLPQAVEQKKQLDEDDYSVPVFIQPVSYEFDNYSNNTNTDKTSPSNPPYMHPSMKFKQGKETVINENSMQQTVSSVTHEPRHNLANSIGRLRDNGSGQQELCAESRLSSETAKRNSSYSQEDLPSENDNTVHDLSDDSGSGEDGSCGPPQMGNLEKGDSVSEASILDNVSSLDITPDDVVGIIGQKHFWKARRAIVKEINPYIEEIYFFSHL